MMDAEKKQPKFDFDEWSKELTESARKGYEKAKESEPSDEPPTPAPTTPEPASSK